MQWKKADLEKYKQAKEYVDTVLIPLMPYHLSQDDHLEKSAFQQEVLGIFAHEIEKELAGRVMLIPNYQYLKSDKLDTETERLNKWIADSRKQPFKHVFLVTFDALWKKSEQALDGSLIWLPGVQSGNLQSEEMYRFIHGQVEQIGELIRSYW